MRVYLTLVVSMLLSLFPLPAFATIFPNADGGISITSQEPATTGIAVLVVRHDGVSETEANAIASHVASAMRAVGITIAVDPENGAKRLKENGYDIVGTATCVGKPKCLTYLGSLLGVGTIVTLEVGAALKSVGVSIVVVSTADSKRLNQLDVTAPKEDLKSGSVAKLNEFAKKLKDSLTRQAQPSAVAVAPVPTKWCPSRNESIPQTTDCPPCRPGTKEVKERCVLDSPVEKPDKVVLDAPKVVPAPAKKWCASWESYMPLEDQCPPCPPGMKEVKEKCVVDDSAPQLVTQPEVVEQKPPQPTRIMRILGIGAAVAGAATMGTGAVFGIQAKSDYDKAKAANGIDRTEFDARKQSGIANSQRADVCLAIGGAALATGVTLFVIDMASHSEPSKSVNVVFTGNGVGVAGTLP